MKYGFRVMIQSNDRANRWTMDKENNILEGCSIVVAGLFFWGVTLYNMSLLLAN